MNILFLLLIGVPKSTNPNWDLNPNQVGPIQPGLEECVKMVLSVLIKN